MGIHSLLLCGIQGWRSGCQAWWPVPACVHVIPLLRVYVCVSYLDILSVGDSGSTKTEELRKVVSCWVKKLERRGLDKGTEGL